METYRPAEAVSGLGHTIFEVVTAALEAARYAGEPPIFGSDENFLSDFFSGDSPVEERMQVIDSLMASKVAAPLTTRANLLGISFGDESSKVRHAASDALWELL